MPLIAYSEFVDRVRKNVFPDTDNDGNEGHLEPTNLRFPHRTYVQNALLKVQTMVECLRQNNVNTFLLDDAIVNCGVAVFTAPEHIRPAAVYAYKPEKGCTRVHYEQKSVGAVMCYVDQFASCKCREESDICNAVRTGNAVCDEWDGDVSEPDTQWLCEEKFFAVGAGSRIYTAPRMPCGYRLAVHWEGIKYRYADEDLISDDPDLLDVVSTYVQAERARTFDRDLALHLELLGKGPPRNGKEGSVFHVKLIDMAFRCKEERRVRKHECLEMWDDSGMGAQLDPLPEREGCTDGQFLKDGECEDCFTPTVTITAEDLSLTLGESVEIHYDSNVPDVEESIVTLEHGEEITTLDRNLAGSMIFSPTQTTTYTIRAVTPCGNITSFVTVEVSIDQPCTLPEGLPTCLQLSDPVYTAVLDVCAPTIDIGGGDPWDGRLPYISPGKWGHEFPNDIFININGSPTQYAFAITLEFMSCDPYRYRLTLYVKLDGFIAVAWQGYTYNSPFGLYLSEDEVSPIGCAAGSGYSVGGCFDTPCTQPEVRFDPPSGSAVNFPSLVFLHSTNNNDSIFYRIDDGIYQPYTGPFSVQAGESVDAYSVTADGCVGDVVSAAYTSDDGLEFAYICDGAKDKAGEFYEFEPDGSNDDYHWRIKATRAVEWELQSAKIYETDENGVWVTGQAWATENPIQPIEGPPNFAVYPLVLFDAYTQVNTDYGNPVETFAAGVTTLDGYGQPFVPLVGYFRLELTIDEGDGPFTIYKLIPHICAPCVTPAAPTLEFGCPNQINVTGNVPAGSRYRIRRATLPDCGSGIYASIVDGISISGIVQYQDTAITRGCSYSYILSQFCDDDWNDSSIATINTPLEPTVSISASRETVCPGDTVTITWESANCDFVIITGIGSVALNGSADIVVNETTVFAITGFNELACDAATDSVTVEEGSCCDTADANCANSADTYTLKQASADALKAAAEDDIDWADCDGNHPDWDRVLTRTTGCNWASPEAVSFEDSAINCYMRLTRTVVGSACQWDLYVGCDSSFGSNSKHYRKEDGGPRGSYSWITTYPGWPSSIIIA